MTFSTGSKGCGVQNTSTTTAGCASTDYNHGMNGSQLGLFPTTVVSLLNPLSQTDMFIFMY